MTAPPAARAAYHAAIGSPDDWAEYLPLLDHALDAAFEAVTTRDHVAAILADPEAIEIFGEAITEGVAAAGGDLGAVDELIAAAVQAERDRILTTPVSERGSTCIRDFAAYGDPNHGDPYARGYNTAMREVADLVTDGQSAPAPAPRGGVPQDAVQAGSLALHEAECSDDTCSTSDHAGYQSDFNDDMSRTVLEAAAPHIAAAPRAAARELERELETRQAALIAAHNERERISHLAYSEASSGRHGPVTARAFRDFARSLADPEGSTP